MKNDELIERAVMARSRAYCPYSGYPVGAALVADSGEVFLGSNVESVVNGLSMCAERVALFNALSQGERSFSKLAVVCEGTFCSPCGACRQTLYEHAPELKVIMANPEGKYRLKELKELLPFPFEL